MGFWVVLCHPGSMPSNDKESGHAGEEIGIAVDAQCGESLEEVVVEPAPDRRRPRLKLRSRRAYKTPKTLSTTQTAEILTLKARGVDYKTIAIKYGMSDSALFNWLSKFDGLVEEVENLSQFRDLRADILTGAHARLLKFVLKENKLSEAPLGQLANALDKVFKQERLERGQSTENTESHSFGTTEITVTTPDKP